MSKFVVPVTLTIESGYGAEGAVQAANRAIRAGTREGVIVSGTVTGDAEECICLTSSELNARIEAAVAASKTPASKTPASKTPASA